MNSHIAGVFPATIATLALVVTVWRTKTTHVALEQLAKLVALEVLLQIGLGIATYYLHLQVEPLTVAHHTLGAALLGTLVAFTAVTIKDKGTERVASSK
jgi:cytochrome c oxidase assembly protein subunit 15